MRPQPFGAQSSAHEPPVTHDSRIRNRLAVLECRRIHRPWRSATAERSFARPRHPPGRVTAPRRRCISLPSLLILRVSLTSHNTTDAPTKLLHARDDDSKSPDAADI